MKAFFKYASLVLGAAILFASCQKEVEIVNNSTPETAQDEVLISIKATEGVDTKTYIDGTAVKWSENGEVLKVYEVKTPTEGEAVTTSKNSDPGSTLDSGATMTFDVSMAAPGEGTFTFDYYAFYPASAFYSGSAVTNIAINTPSTQTPVAGSFDPAADLLIAKHISNGDSQASNLNMEFARVVAIAKMTIKNLASTDPVTKITFSAKEGENAIKLAGRTAFNLSNGNLVNSYGGNVGDFSIILDVATLNATANSAAGMTTFFTCYPFAINSENPGSIKVVVETATQTFTREVSVNSAKGLALNAGKASIFAINMEGVVGENKAVDLCYAYLEYSDVSSQLSNSYGNASVTKTHGDTWSMYATNANSSVIALKNGDVASFIKLPDFEDDITSVTVTLSEVTATKTLTFDSVQGENTGDLGGVAFVAETLKYTVDLSSSNVKTAYIHSVGSQAKIVKVEVIAGTDTREEFDAPASVTAALNGDDANAIDVTWSTVEGASGYVITLVPDSGDDVVVKSNASSCKVSDLQYEMDYVVSVQAEPADYYLNKISGQTTAEDVVTTGADDSGVIVLTSSEITVGANTVQGTNNGKLAYRMGTSNNNGSLTFAAGYSSITFTLAGWASGTRSFSITNGTINDSASLSPAAGSPSGTINANFSTSYDGTEYTINVTDSEQEVVFSGRRCVVWGFSAVEATPTTPTVATPTFSINAGFVSIACATDGATIYYTTNGDDPDTSSSVYSEPISILGNQSKTIKALATKTDYDNSEIGSETYYAVNISAMTNGTVTAVPFAAAGDEVSLNVTPVNDYALDTLSVVNDSSSAAVAVTNNQFTMPASSVTVSATFATASYDFETIAELNALVTDTSSSYNGYLTDAVVSFVPATNTAIVKDATGSVMFYKSSHGLLQGQTYTGEITVTAIKYNSLYSEITAWENATFTGSQTTVAPQSVTLAELTGHYDDYQNAYVQVSGLTVVSVSSKNINVTDGVNSYVVYDNPGTATCAAGDVITAVGTITKYQTTEELKVWAAADITITGSAPKAVTFTQPTGAAATAGCSIAVTVGGNPHTSGNTVASGTTVTLTATEGTDYEFTSWSVTGALVADPSASTTTFVMGTSAVSISANFTSTGGNQQTPTLQYTLTPASTGANSSPHNSYTAAATTTIDGIGWSVMGNSYMTPWRIGGKNISEVNRPIYSTTAISANISQIVITHGAASSITVNSMTVYVCSTAAGAAADTPTNVVASFTPTFVANGDVTINKADNTSWANCFYRIVYNVTVSGNTNRYVSFNEVKFYGTN